MNLSQIRPGDLLAISGKALLSALIKAFDDGDYSHVGIACPAAGRVKIIEAVPGDDVAVNDLAKSYQGTTVGVYRLPEKYRDVTPALAETGLGMVGLHPYDFLQLIDAARGTGDDNDSGLVCSQLVNAVYREHGFDLPANEHGFHTPNSIVNGLVKIGEICL